jgi:hypothetical protein
MRRLIPSGSSIPNGSAWCDDEKRGATKQRMTASLPPRYIRMHPGDNVAVVVNPDGLAAGSRFPCGLELREAVPESHKVALGDLAPGDAILRYGVVIGYANRAIPRGSWVHEDLVTPPAAPALDACPLATAVPAPLPKLDGFTFEGFRNADGSVGTKNILGISTTVQCVAATVDYAVKRIKAEILPRYPNVDDVVAITHPYGCGVAIDAPGAAIPIRTLRNLSLSPNFGGELLLVSLGCEKLQPLRLIPASFLPVLEDEASISVMQEAKHGFGEIVHQRSQSLGKRSQRSNQRRCGARRPAVDRRGLRGGPTRWEDRKPCKSPLLTCLSGGRNQSVPRHRGSRCCPSAQTSRAPSLLDEVVRRIPAVLVVDRSNPTPGKRADKCEEKAMGHRQGRQHCDRVRGWAG